jgi:ribosomal protein S18 acetylase RimI-like enzyme
VTGAAGSGVEIGRGDRELAPVLAELHLRTALAGYGHIFPAEAPPPTREELLVAWERSFGVDRDLGPSVFVARRRDEVVGVVVAARDPEDLDLGHLERLYVDRSCWGQGVGRELYRAAEDQMRRDGLPAATLWVLERNERARRWYERLGWRTTGEVRPVYAPAGIDDVQYRLDLQAVAR